MGILDDLFWGFGPDFAGSDRKLKKLIAEGERLRARIDGIRVVYKSDSADEYNWRLAVRGPTGEFVAGVRQQLTPKEELVTLGSEVDVLHLDGRTAIDWPRTLERLVGEPGGSILPVKMRMDAPDPGIVDERLDTKRLERGTRTTARVLATEPVFALGMPTQNQHLTLQLADGREVVVKRALIPGYAHHLLSVGAALPVAVDAKKPDKVSVDWPAAAMAAAARA